MKVKYKNWSINKKLLSISLSAFLPMVILAAYLIVSLNNAASAYSEITKSIAYANRYVKDFKSRLDYSVYLAVVKFLPAYIYPTVIIAIIVLIVIIIVMKYTKFGRSVYAIGGNEQSALMMGLNVKRTKMAAYLLDGFLAGLGGFLFCMNSCAGFVEQAKGLEMDAISAAVIGGTLLSGGVGTPFGTLFGVLIKGTISSLITTQGTLSSWWVRIVLSALLCFFIVLQSVFASLKKKN